MVTNLPAIQETWVQSLGWEDPLEKGMATHSSILEGFPGGSEGKASACNAGDLGWIPVLGRSSGEGNGYPFQCSPWGIPWTEELVGLQSMGLQSQTQLSD